MEKKSQEHLPLMGVGPICIAVIFAFTVGGIVLKKIGMIAKGDIGNPVVSAIFIVAGVALVVGGIALWCTAVLKARIDEKIKSNQLATEGVYGLVRNPIYSAFLFLCTGVLLFCRNWVLLILPFIFWGFLTAVMKFTEEKWLKNLFGESYVAYCKRVNRFIPCKKIKNR